MSRARTPSWSWRAMACSWWGNIHSSISALDIALCAPGKTTWSTRRPHSAAAPLQACGRPASSVLVPPPRANQVKAPPTALVASAAATHAGQRRGPDRPDDDGCTHGKEGQSAGKPCRRPRGNLTQPTDEIEGPAYRVGGFQHCAAHGREQEASGGDHQTSQTQVAVEGAPHALSDSAESGIAERGGGDEAACGGYGDEPDADREEGKPGAHEPAAPVGGDGDSGGDQHGPEPERGQRRGSHLLGDA